MEIQLFATNFAFDHVEISEGTLMGGWLHGGMEKPTTLTENFTRALGAGGATGHLPNVLLREERWGGLVFQANSSAVYQVDKEGFNVLKRLKSGESIEAIRANTNQPTVEALDKFIGKASTYSLL